jgi:tetratricopeptide (TPR) repeat protein
MQPDQNLERQLARLRRRLRLLRAERCGFWAGSAGALGAAALAVLGKLRLLSLEWPYLAGLVALGLAGGWVVGFLLRLSRFEAARLTETRLRLKERLSSAVSLSPGRGDAAWVGALVDDARRQLGRVSPARVFPRRFSMPLQAFTGLALVTALVMILPELPMLQSAKRKAEAAELREKGKEVIRLSRELEKLPEARKQPSTSQLPKTLRHFGEEMKAGKLTKRQALLEAHELRKQVERAQEQLAGEKGKSLQRAAQELRAAASQRELAKTEGPQVEGERLTGLPPGMKPEDLAKLTPEQAKALAKYAKPMKPGTPLLNLDKDLVSIFAELLSREDYQKAMEILERLAGKLGSPEARELSEEELKELAEQLKKLGEILKNTDLDELAKALLEAAKELENMSPEEAARLLKEGCKGCKGACLGLGLRARLAAIGACLGSCGVGGRGVGPGNSLSRYDPSYKSIVHRGEEKRTEVGQYDTKVAGQPGPGGEMFLTGEVRAAPEKSEAGKVPYYEVYPDYKQAAEEALAKEQIPPAHRKRVKDYFESLKPQ